MTNQAVLAGMVRNWVEQQRPGEPALAAGAVAAALDRYGAGGSVSGACLEAQEYFGSWIRHPAHRRAVALVPRSDGSAAPRAARSGAPRVEGDGWK